MNILQLLEILKGMAASNPSSSVHIEKIIDKETTDIMKITSICYNEVDKCIIIEC